MKNLVDLTSFLSLSATFLAVIVFAQDQVEYEYENVDMGSQDYLEPPDFNSNPFPDPNQDPFSRRNQFESTENPFRRPSIAPIVTSTTEVNFNDLQNNELGNGQPYDPFTPQEQRYDRNRPRPQVDEFGNPLGKHILSI